jgi:hypothetical protein
MGSQWLTPENRVWSEVDSQHQAIRGGESPESNQENLNESLEMKEKGAGLQSLATQPVHRRNT